MAKAKIVGQNKLVYINEDKAKKILEWKSNGTDPERIVDLGGIGFVALGQIKQVFPDDPAVLKEEEINEQKSRERQNEIAEYEIYVQKCRDEDPETKSRRMVKSWCFLLWKTRGNKPNAIPEDLADDILIRLIPFFTMNPTEWKAEMKLYQDLIPLDTPSLISNVSGMPSIGQAMQGKLV